MKLIINGDPKEFSEKLNLMQDLIIALDLSDQRLLVELNGEAVISSEINKITIEDGDKIEFVEMVPGG